MISSCCCRIRAGFDAQEKKPINHRPIPPVVLASIWLLRPSHGINRLARASIENPVTRLPTQRLRTVAERRPILS